MPAMTVTIWGARGSVPTPGPDRAIYGGNTPCVEVTAGDQTIVIDAGTGIVPLGRRLVERGVKKITLLLSHLHHDHVGGLPFFAPLFDPSIEVTVHCGHLDGNCAHSALDELFRPPFFPLVFSEMAPHLKHVGFVAGETFTLGDVNVSTIALHHPGSATAFRCEREGKVFIYSTDVEHLSPTPDPDMVAFVHAADVLMYDTMLDACTAKACKGWGHSTWQGGAALAQAGDVKLLAAFHHHPMFDDAKIATLEKALHAEMPNSFFCREGQVIEI